MNKIDEFIYGLRAYQDFYSPKTCYSLDITNLVNKCLNRECLIPELKQKITESLKALSATQLAFITDLSKNHLEVKDNEQESIEFKVSEVIYKESVSVKLEKQLDLLKEEVSALEEDISLEGMSNWSNFIVRDKSWDQLAMYNTNGTQEAYGRRMQRAVALMSDVITAGSSFENLCNYSAILRANIARELKHQNAGSFGIKRTFSGDSTPLGGVYENLGLFLGEKDLKIRNGEVDSFYKINPCLYNSKMHFGAVKGFIGEKEIELSELCFYPNNGRKVLVHTQVENIPIIMEYTKELYEQALKTDNPTEVKEIAGRIFWWICQAKPWVRGDPSIAEIIVRSIFTVKGIPNHPWKNDTIPWTEAMKDFNPEDFSKRFYSLFADTEWE